MKITLPKKTDSTQPEIDVRNITVIGANGSGKTRFGVNIEKKYINTSHRISAQKSLSMPEGVNTTTVEVAERIFYYGHHNISVSRKKEGRWGENPNTHLLDDFGKLMVLLHTKEYEESIRFKDNYIKGQSIDKPITPLDKILAIWEDIITHRKLDKKAGKIETFPTSNPDRYYNASEMSDGERVIFYLIGEAVSVPKDTILIIDEPEMHLHKSIMNKLWDKIEQERPDCTFIYLTQDIDFACSRENSTKIWIRGYDGEFWDYEILEENSGLPEQVYLEILGSRRPILFVEGDDSSIDYRLFRVIFPEYTIKALGSCEKVFEITKSFNQLKDFHHNECLGLVDRDRRTDDDISHINNQSIHVAEVAEVENLLLLEEVIKAVAEKMGKSPEDIFIEVRRNVVDCFSRDLEYQATQHTISRIEAILRRAISSNRVKSFNDLDKNLNALWDDQDFRKIYEEIRSDFEELVKRSDYYGILKVFNNKGLVCESKVPELCDLRTKNDAYLNQVIEILKQQSGASDKVRSAILKATISARTQ